MERSTIMGSGDPILDLEDIRKSFPGVLVLDGVSLTIEPGEVHVLFGENGAGKSTLVNILAGTYQPDGGRMRMNGEEMRFAFPKAAREKGINAVFQELSLVPSLTVAANVFLGRETVQRGLLREAEMEDAVAASFERLRCDIDPRAVTGNLSRAERQMVEIAKALQGDPKVLILDEPTTSFTDEETARLFDIVRLLRSQGLGIVYITHRMREIRAIGDRISVLRDGRCIRTCRVSEVDDDALISLMTGREALNIYPTISFAPKQSMIELRGACGQRGLFRDVSLHVRAGEIVGLAGLVGCGKSAIGRAVFGEDRLASGDLLVAGRAVAAASPAEMLRRGIVYLPPDRRRQGLVLSRAVRENATLSALRHSSITLGPFLRKGRERSAVQSIADQLALRPPDIESDVSTLSGGNQQKVVFARAFLHETKVLVVDEPTVGVDVGARLEFYGILKQLCEAGAAILLISSDLPEILHLSHRVYVMTFGKLAREFGPGEIEEGPILSAFFRASDDTLSHPHQSRLQQEAVFP